MNMKTLFKHSLFALFSIVCATTTKPITQSKATTAAINPLDYLTANLPKAIANPAAADLDTLAKEIDAFEANEGDWTPFASYIGEPDTMTLSQALTDRGHYNASASLEAAYNTYQN